MIEPSSLPSDRPYKQALIDFIKSGTWHLFITIPVGGCENDDAIVQRLRIIEATLCKEYLVNRYHRLPDKARFLLLVAFEGDRKCGTRHAHILAYVPVVAKKCTQISRKMLLAVLKQKFRFLWVTLKRHTNRDFWLNEQTKLYFGDANIASSTYVLKDVRLRDVHWSRFDFVTPPKWKKFSNRNLSVIQNKNCQKRRLLQRNGDPLLLNNVV